MHSSRRPHPQPEWAWVRAAGPHDLRVGKVKPFSGSLISLLIQLCIVVRLDLEELCAPSSLSQRDHDLADNIKVFDLVGFRPKVSASPALQYRKEGQRVTEDEEVDLVRHILQ